MIIRPMAVAVLMCALLQPSLAVTLQPGTYKLAAKFVPTTDKDHGYQVMSGTMKTDTGEIPVSVRDTNFNGTCNDKTQVSGSISMPSYGQGLACDRYIEVSRSADMVSLGDGNRETGVLHLGKAVRYEGKLYTMEVSPAYDKLTVGMYTGDTGVVKLKATNGQGKPVSVDHVILYSDCGWFRSDEGSDTITVPVGEYTCGYAQLPPQVMTSVTTWAGHAVPPDKPVYVMKGFGYSRYLDMPVSVRKNQETIVKLGGALGLEFAVMAKRTEMAAKRGTRIQFQVFLTLDGERVHGIRDLPVNLDVISPSGQTVYTVNKGFGHMGNGTMPYSFIENLKLKEDWMQGIYKLRATADTGSYQGILTAESKLVIQ
jgi:hypothetical protein